MKREYEQAPPLIISDIMAARSGCPLNLWDRLLDLSICLIEALYLEREYD